MLTRRAGRSPYSRSLTLADCVPLRYAVEFAQMADTIGPCIAAGATHERYEQRLHDSQLNAIPAGYNAKRKQRRREGARPGPSMLAYT